MTPRWPTSRSRSAAGGLALLIVLAAGSADAFAQACCAGGSLVTPTRLAIHEDYAVGLQVRARSDPGSFDATGHYAASNGAEQLLEQDFAGSVRVLERGQIGVLVPMIQTHRSAPPHLDDWGGGLGDLSLTARYDPLLATESLHWPGIGLLAGADFPTGTPPDKATDPLAADATGAGTYDVTVGVDVEKVSGHFYGAVNGWLTHRFARTLAMAGGPLTESFSLRWTLLGVASYVFDSEAALGLYVTSFGEGPATINGAEDPTSPLRLTTLGAAGVIPLRDVWRVQGSAFYDLPVASLGRNEPAGYGLTVSLVRVWL